MVEMSNILIVAGTRPEIIKLAPVMEHLEKLGADFKLVWSGQHYDYEMSRIFFEELGTPEPAYNLEVGSGSHAKQTSKIMVRLEKVLVEERPKVVIAEGDTNTVVASALTSVKMKIPFGHVEAGLRSWDRTMPEEINRIIADSISTLYFAPTRLAVINLVHEGVPLEKIYLTGNTIVDVVLKYKDKALKMGIETLRKLGLKKENYLLVTVHRAENTDNPSRLKNIFNALLELSEYYPVVLPLHPRTRKRLKDLNMLSKVAEKLIISKPIGYFQFLGLLAYCKVVLTDSGGVQEEALTLHVPTITLRYNTERPETVKVGLNRLVGAEKKLILEATLKVVEERKEIVRRVSEIPNPLGDGRAGERIAKILSDFSGKIKETDTRTDPYIVYRISSKRTPGTELIAFYNEKGVPVLNEGEARFYLERGSESIFK